MYKGSRGVTPVILHLGYKEGRMVRFMLQPLYHYIQKPPWHPKPLNRKFGGPKASLDVPRNRKILFFLQELNPGSSSSQPNQRLH
jgi:hypothetical protein